MQTFLPYPDFQKSAQVLDMRRLGKQRVECKQIYLALKDPSRGWANHPATKMWKGYENSLLFYSFLVCHEWRSRGYKDSLQDFFLQEYEYSGKRPQDPPWLGNEAFHASHRSNLLRKDPVWYGKFGWCEPPDLPYVWPVV